MWIFFFSSRRRHTRFDCDWSSDVCSSDLFTARNDFNTLASDDEWTAPISPEVGPDGALWYVDWYNYIVQHNPIPRGFKSGKGGAYETPLPDKIHGRIYRLIYTAPKPSKPFNP